MAICAGPTCTLNDISPVLYLKDLIVKRECSTSKLDVDHARLMTGEGSVPHKRGATKSNGGQSCRNARHESRCLPCGGLRVCVTGAPSYLKDGFLALAATGQAERPGPLPRGPETLLSGQGSRPRDLKLWC